jgi:hypothetical protein
MITVEFLITSLIVVLVPGTGVVLTVSTGLTRGRRASVYAALGCTAGIVPHLMTTVLGLAAIMHTSAVAQCRIHGDGVRGLRRRRVPRACAAPGGARVAARVRSDGREVEVEAFEGFALSGR